jgi:hypothetical protein
MTSWLLDRAVAYFEVAPIRAGPFPPRAGAAIASANDNVPSVDGTPTMSAVGDAGGTTRQDVALQPALCAGARRQLLERPRSVIVAMVPRTCDMAAAELVALRLPAWTEVGPACRSRPGQISSDNKRTERFRNGPQLGKHAVTGNVSGGGSHVPGTTDVTERRSRAVTRLPKSCGHPGPGPNRRTLRGPGSNASSPRA